ncbi:MAG: hypothetical protein C0423_04255 [Methylibium sp.]|nr:hypothetical protein [Methylibium sp.]
MPSSIGRHRSSLVWFDERPDYSERRIDRAGPEDRNPVLRGRAKSENKKLLASVRYSPEVVAYFKSTGEGWQSRMDSVLQQYVARQSRQS